MNYERYAVYYAPQVKSALGQFGSSWLGWDAENRTPVNRPTVGTLSSSEIEVITQTPARYGFHGTLKPPFRLKEDKNFRQLDNALSDMVKNLSFLSCGPLKLEKLGKFIALVPTNCDRALGRLAGQCVEKLDQFRAAPSEVELEKRRQKGLTPRQDALLEQWGYPYVMEEFRFHLTLTGALEDDQIKVVYRELEKATRTITSPAFQINELCLFGDPGAGQPFHLLKRYSL